MPKKVLYFIIFLLVMVIFFIENNDKCDIVFFLPFLKLEKVPIVYSLAVSFVLGMLVILPFTVFKGKNKTNKSSKPAKKGDAENVPEENVP
jgi:uncharacterized integral membrane protein